MFLSLSQFTAIKDVASTVANSVDLTVQPSTTTLTLISTTLALALLEMCGQNKIIAIWGHRPCMQNCWPHPCTTSVFKPHWNVVASTEGLFKGSCEAFNRKEFKSLKIIHPQEVLQVDQPPPQYCSRGYQRWWESSRVLNPIKNGSFWSHQLIKKQLPIICNISFTSIFIDKERQSTVLLDHAYAHPPKSWATHKSERSIQLQIKTSGYFDSFSCASF